MSLKSDFHPHLSRSLGSIYLYKYAQVFFFGVDILDFFLWNEGVRFCGLIDLLL